jgi:predicted P-loop ATPase
MDTPFDFHGKEGIEAIQGKWIVEMAELDSFSKSENTTAKSFLPRKVDRFRLPYGKRSKDFPRCCIFAGTTNEGEYFRDPTGNRRYHPVYCHYINRDALTRDRMLLLGEAVARMKKGERVYPTPQEEDRLIKPEQEKRMINDFWIEKIGDFLIGKTVTTMTEIIEKALTLDAGKVDESRIPQRVGRCMTKLGWVKRDLGSTRKAERFIYVKKGVIE